jgi:hypothetical protein
MSSHLPAFPLSSQKEECLSQIARSFQELSMQTEEVQHSSIPFLCKVHDEILQILSQDADATAKRIHTYILRLRLLETKEEATHIQQYITLEADLYRAVSLTSLYLMEQMPLAMNQPLSPAVEENLQSSFQRSQILLEILETIYSQCNQEGELLSTNHSILDEWLHKLKPRRINEENLISFDRERLQMEEDELLQMAATPTPQEKYPTANRIATNHEDDSGLTARLWLDPAAASDSSSRTSITLFWNGQGVLRSRDAIAEHSWWLVTCESSISYQAPNLIITSVITNNTSKPEFSTIPSLTLDVGTDGALWWERVSKMVHKLQEIKELQDELNALWTSEEIEANLKKAQIQVSMDSTALN